MISNATMIRIARVCWLCKSHGHHALAARIARQLPWSIA